MKFLETVIGGRWKRAVGHAAEREPTELVFACVDVVAAAEMPTPDAATTSVPATTAALVNGPYRPRTPYLKWSIGTFPKG